MHSVFELQVVYFTQFQFHYTISELSLIVNRKKGTEWQFYTQRPWLSLNREDSRFRKRTEKKSLTRVIWDANG